VTAEECNVAFTKDEECAREASRALCRGQKVTLFINSQMLYIGEQHKTSWTPNHWVALTSPLAFTPVLGGSSPLVSFSVFTWGSIRAVPTSGGLPLSDFVKNFYGYIACKASGL
jgi:hypothetical protein